MNRKHAAVAENGSPVVRFPALYFVITLFPCLGLLSQCIFLLLLCIACWWSLHEMASGLVILLDIYLSQMQCHLNTWARRAVAGAEGGGGGEKQPEIELGTFCFKCLYSASE